MRDCPNCIDKTTQGFTLIELLVAVTIIGVISAVGLASLTGVRGKTQDTVRKNDLKTLATALELYFQKNGEYLVDSTVCPKASNVLYTDSEFAKLINGPLPKDPKTDTNYCYETDSEGLNYKLIAKLDDNTDHILTSEDYIAEARTTPTPTLTSTPRPTATPRPTRTPRPTAIPIDCANSLLINNQPIGSDRFGPTSFQAYSGNSYSIKGIYQGRFSLKVTSPNTDLGDFENSGIGVWNTDPNDIDEPHEVQLIDPHNDIICRRNVNVKKQNLFEPNPDCRGATQDRAMNIYVSTYKDNNFNPSTWPVYNFIGCPSAPPPDDPNVGSIPSFIAEAKNRFQSVLGISTKKDLLAVGNTCTNPSENSSNCCGTTSLQGMTLSCSNYCQLGNGNPSSLAFGNPSQSLKNAVVHVDSATCAFRYTKIVGNNPTVTFDSIPAALNIRGSNRIHEYYVWVEAPNNEQFTRSLCYTSGSDNPSTVTSKNPEPESCIIKGDISRNPAAVAGNAYKGYK